VSSISMIAGIAVTEVAIKIGQYLTMTSIYPGTQVPVPAQINQIPTGTDDQNILPDPSIAYTFQDEFNGPAGSAPSALWKYDLGGGGWGNNELETYTNSRNNSYLDGQGHLVIAATTDRNGHYWSARLTTNGTFAQQGGHFEARVQLNAQAGIWPAFWMMGNNFNSAGWPQCGEVDIFENYGIVSAPFIETTVHTPNGSTTYNQHTDIVLDNEWHTYRLDWDLEAETFAFSRDGAPYFTVSAEQYPTESWVFGPASSNNGGMFFLLNVAVGGFVGIPSTATQFPALMLVDYVRAWR
jgi:beta-glucanase (GH16 family)